MSRLAVALVTVVWLSLRSPQQLTLPRATSSVRAGQLGRVHRELELRRDSGGRR